MDDLADPFRFADLSAAIEAARPYLSDVYLRLPEGFRVQGVSLPESPEPGTALFAVKADPGLLDRLTAAAPVVAVVPPGTAAGGVPDGVGLLEASDPKYAYAVLLRALVPLYAERGREPGSRGVGTVVGEGALIGRDVTMEEYVTVAPGAVIGDGCYLMRGAAVGPRVRLGRRCVLKENAALGDAGFGFGMAPGLPHVRIPQLGGVIIGDDVEVGAFSSVGAGTIRPTVIEDGAKISNHVHIAHNCVIGRGTIVTCGVSVSGSTRIGAGCWLAPQAVLRNKLVVGDYAFIGMGAVVVKDVDPGLTVLGNPARPKQ